MAQTGFTPLQIYSSSTAAAAPVAGNLTNSTLGSELAINITDGKLFYKDNANAIQVIAWKTTPTTAGGTGLTSYTAGDTLYYASGTTLSKLGIGASKTIMTSSGTAPQWSTSLDTSQGGTGVTSYTAGDLPYYVTGTVLSKLGIGSANTVLTSSGTAPQWTAQSSLAVGTASNLKSNVTTGVMQIVGPAAAATRVMTIPDANFTAARTDAAQTFTGNQSVTGSVLATGSLVAATNRTFVSAAVFFDDTINGNNTGIGLAGASVFPTNGAGAGSNNTKSIGNASFRWSEVFAVNGTINTSDRNAKQDILELDDAEKRVAQRIKQLVKKYRFKDAVAQKGEAARIHVGFIAQEIEQAFISDGLDAERYGVFCRDTWYEVDGSALDENKREYTKDAPGAVEKTTVGLRYDQIFAFIVTAL